MAQFTYDRLGVSLVAAEGKVFVNGCEVTETEFTELRLAMKAARRVAELGDWVATNEERRKREVELEGGAEDGS